MINILFFGFFCFEIAAKILGEGFKFYLRDKYNWFDAGVVFISTIDILLVGIFRNTANGTTYLVFQYIYR
jgi:uncharacterized membrane protein YuzA (DUF378 family)